ncbi:RdgB/HAM1 family non-canonical purine NTP pyrophosphatase [uncultured Anaerococcus sp.]|uniref:RdgB/HAM1 family non-canonical purine NTP pyrophosphatase n=1 Tax=uncultured Anaerococcus sp. TaxID=293428 RepID=UPI0025E32CBF|nr:RdgB/HAM1 family non-canonical purine NTP pyrophosphatase [uncultured Anaerococcus sp.]
MKLVFASNNENKLKQVKLLLNHDKIYLPKDLGIENFDVIEDGNTLRENAFKKAHELYKLTKADVFSDDTGLFVKALDNRPGIYSHRYAGEDATDKDNRVKLLSELENFSNRDAYFETVVCFISKDGKAHYFKGKLDGKISLEEKGEGGFGYDKIFYVNKYGKTLAEMDIEFKNKISHRGLAIKKFKEFLEGYYENPCN